jgi:hypothetical protein
LAVDSVIFTALGNNNDSDYANRKHFIVKQYSECPKRHMHILNACNSLVNNDEIVNFTGTGVEYSR